MNGATIVNSKVKNDGFNLHHMIYIVLFAEFMSKHSCQIVPLMYSPNGEWEQLENILTPQPSLSDGDFVED